MGTLKKANAKFKKKAEDGEAMPRKFTEGYEETPNTMRNSGDRALAKSKYYSENQLKTKATPEKKAESFGEAFKRNRVAGAKTFTYNGKSYTTETNEEATKKAPAKPLGNRPPAKSAASPSPASKLTSGPKTPSTGTYTPPGKPASSPLENNPPAKKVTSPSGQSVVDKAKSTVPARTNYTPPGKPAGKPAPVNTSAKARKGLPPMKTGGKAKKKCC